MAEFTPKVVTGNDLLLGDVVYLASNNTWVRALRDAQLLTSEDAAEARLAFGETMPNSVVGVYLADAKSGEHGPAPTHFREEFRRTGPSNYHHGKQEGFSHV